MQLTMSFSNEESFQIVCADIVVDKVLEAFWMRLEELLDDEKTLSTILAEASEEGRGVAWR